MDEKEKRLLNSIEELKKEAIVDYNSFTGVKFGENIKKSKIRVFITLLTILAFIFLFLIVTIILIPLPLMLANLLGIFMWGSYYNTSYLLYKKYDELYNYYNSKI